MYLQNELKSIAERLFKEKICQLPLDEKSLNAIYHYMGMSDTGCDLMRRLSDIEINYNEISDDAESAAQNVNESFESCIRCFKELIDGWEQRGILKIYSFSVSNDDIEVMYAEYSTLIERISTEISKLEGSSSILAETAYQIKACSASFLEVYNDTRLAYYAAAFNRDKENMLSCKAISLQAHDSFAECDKASSKLLRTVASVSTALSIINALISEATVWFGNAAYAQNPGASALVNKIINGIEALKALSAKIK